VIPDAEIWRAGMAMVKRYGDDAILEAAPRARQLIADGDLDGSTTWQHIGEAIERLQAKGPTEGEKVH
jgi:hypothetical protein